MSDLTVRVPLEPPFPRKFIAYGVRTVNGKAETKYLHWDSEGGGWYQWGNTQAGAKEFDSEKAAMSAAKNAPGPSYNIPNMKTVAVTQVETAKHKTYREMIKLGAESLLP